MAVEALGQNVDEEAADELVCCERHHLVAIGAFDPIVLVLEADTVSVERDQSAVGDGDGDAMSEVVALKVSDIDSGRMMIRIEQSKRRKHPRPAP